MVKLTKPQIDLLLQASMARLGVMREAHNRPLVRLRREGFMGDENGEKGTARTDRWFITKDGEAWIEEYKKKPAK